MEGSLNDLSNLVVVQAGPTRLMGLVRTYVSDSSPLILDGAIQLVVMNGRPGMMSLDFCHGPTDDLEVASYEWKYWPRMQGEETYKEYREIYTQVIEENKRRKAQMKSGVMVAPAGVLDQLNQKLPPRL